MKRHILIGWFACLLGITTMSHAQAIPTASRVSSIQVGLGGMITSPDYAQQYIKGLTLYGDYNFQHNIGVEAEIHYSLITPTDLSENTYLIGPRYVVRRKNFTGYAKVLLGMGRFGTQGGSFGTTTTTSYTAYAFGGGLEYMAPHNLNVRILDVELQKWPSFPTNGLSPISYSIGVAYAFH
ncbi:MAG: outer membrane beta-barrel protein [Edaphobacter sp.]